MRHDLHGVIDTGERWVRSSVDRTTRWVRANPKTAAGIGAGVVAAFWALVIYNRKSIGRAVSATLDTAVAALLDKVLAAPLDMPIPPYALLPPGPPEIGPLAGDNSFDSLTDEFRPRAQGVYAEVRDILAPHGIDTRVVETRRSNLRQLFLWGIGRFYRAPGRSGIVTKVRSTKTGAKHTIGEAEDFAYVKGGKLLNGDQVAPYLAPHAARLEAKYRVKWGGNFKGPFKDVPHWEAA